MQYIHPKRNNYAMTGVASVVCFFFVGILTLRRHGLGTDWARIRYMCASGEYRTLVEAGALPENNHLPPHMRLDRLSYLDRKDTEVAFPPLYNVMESDKERLGAVAAQVPASQMTEIRARIGLVKTHSLGMSKAVDERYVKRKLDVSDEERAMALQEQMDKARAQQGKQ